MQTRVFMCTVIAQMPMLRNKMPAFSYDFIIFKGQFLFV